MAQELCEIHFVRQDLRQPMVVFVRLLDKTGATVLAFPWRLERGVMRTWPMMLDPTLSIDIASCEPDGAVSAHLRPCGSPPGPFSRAAKQARKYVRAFRNYLDPIPPQDTAGRISAWTTRSPPPADARVSIVIPTRDRHELIARAIETLFENADWPNKELVIVDNGSTESATLALFERVRKLPNVQILRDDRPFNYSQLINVGAAAARGDVLALMNNDVETDRRDWIQPLLALACAPEVGAVGAKLLFGDGSVQHAGITLGIRGIAGHAGVGRSPDDPGPYGILSTTRRVSAVTGACTFTRREIFERVGGLDENYVVELNDVDFCLRIGALGLAIVYDAESILIHNEGSTRQQRPLREQEVLDRQRFIRQWGRSLVNDPYYPADLTLRDDSLAFLTAYDR